MSAELESSLERWLRDPRVTTIVLAHVAHSAVVLDTAYVATMEEAAGDLARRFLRLAERHAASIGIVQRYSVAAMADATVIYQEPLRMAPGVEFGVALGETERGDSDGIKKASMRHLEAQSRMAVQVQAKLSDEASRTIDRQGRRIALLEANLDALLQRQVDLAVQREALLSEQSRRDLKAAKHLAHEARQEQAFGMLADFVRVGMGKQTHASTIFDFLMAVPVELRDAMLEAMTPAQLDAYQVLMHQALEAKKAESRLIERQQPDLLRDMVPRADDKEPPH